MPESTPSRNQRVPASAHFIWNDAEGRGRNRYVLFRRTFHLDGQPARGEFHLFADTRYRLMVNGCVIGHGPARFFPSHPEYDSYNLDRCLLPGTNVIAALVNSAGGASFHNQASVGGLIAWGEARDDAGHVVEIATDEEWRALESPGHRPNTHRLSFALNAAEFLDAREMPEGWEGAEFDDSAWPHAVLHAHPDHWGPLRPRSIPLLDERKVAPRRRLSTFAARENPEDEVYSLAVTTAGNRGLNTRGRVMVMAYLHSPRAQEIRFGAWWGKYWVNGAPCQGQRPDNASIRQDFTAQLREGWNLLQMFESLHSDWWDFYLALPHSARIIVAAEPDAMCQDTFLIGGPWEEDRLAEADSLALPLDGPESLPPALGPWTRWPRSQEAESPVRERAWKRFERIADDPAEPPDVRVLASAVGDDTLSLLFDFGTEVLGRPVLEFVAATGTVVDLTYNERLKEDGSADVHFRHFVDMAERYIAQEGRQTWQTFHPRGMRYLEVLVRGNLEQFELLDVGLTRANYPVQDLGSFECSDPLLNEIWRVGRDTVHACMEDSYLDCPHRERGLYGGDFLVEFFGNLAVFGDTRLFRRCIELFFQGQVEKGLLPGGAFGLPGGGGGSDYSAIVVQSLLQYQDYSGDTSFLEELAPRLERVLQGLDSFRVDGTPLLDGSKNSYVDLAHADRRSVNCALNCFYQKAFADGADLFRVLGDAEKARYWEQRAESLASAIRDEFWEEEQGVFVDRRRADVPETGPSVHANSLAILYDIATEEQARRALEWLCPAMLNNFRTPDPQDNDDCNVTSYFSYYALGALFRYGRDAEALEFIRRYWGRMLEHGAWTWWEYFLEGQGASLCHAWSACPTHYLSTAVLGIHAGGRGDEPGSPQSIIIRPCPGDLSWASGVYPHPAGPITVRWERKLWGLEVTWDAPEGVRVEVVPEGEAAK